MKTKWTVFLAITCVALALSAWAEQPVSNPARSSLGTAVFTGSEPTPASQPLVGNAAPETASSCNVLIIQNQSPWGETSDTTVLDGLGMSYSVVSTATVDTMSDAALAAYPVILMASQQTVDYYNWLNTNMTRFQTYVQNGGHWVVFAARYFPGDCASLVLPGGLSYYCPFGAENNYIGAASDPIVSQVLSQNVPLTNADLYGSYCSHGYFNDASVPAGATVVFRESDSGSGHPTTVRYSFGSGQILASCLTWEVAYYYGWAFATKALDDVFLSVCQGTSTYNLSFLDDLGRNSLCINSSSGNYLWKILKGNGAGTSYTGTGQVTSTTTLLTLTNTSGASQRIMLNYYKVPKSAAGYCLCGTQYLTLFDSNTANGPTGLCN